MSMLRGKRSVCTCESPSHDSKRNTAHLVVPLEGPPKLTDQPDQHQLSNHGQFCVDNRRQGGEDRGKWQRRCLSLHDRPCIKTSSSDQVFAKQLRYDVFDVRYVDLMRKEGSMGIRQVSMHQHTLLIKPLILFLRASQLIL
jgi:hypothetical protein